MIAMSTLEVSLWIAACAACVFLSGVFSAAETGIYTISRLRLMVAAHRRETGAGQLHKLLQDQSGLLSTTLLGTNVANYLAPACLIVIFLGTAAAELTPQQADARAEFLATAILTPIVFIFGEVVPKNLFQRHADRFMVRVAPLLAASHRVFLMTGLIRLQKSISEWLLRRLSHHPAPVAALESRREVYQMLKEHATEAELSGAQSEMVESVHRLRITTVGSVMMPLSRVVMVAADVIRRDIDSTVRQSRHSRMPVFEGDRRRVVGVVHLLDVLDMPPGDMIRSRMRSPLEIKPAANVMDALGTLQSHRRRMGVVTDGRGRCIGIVTVKDLVEEIVGELVAW